MGRVDLLLSFSQVSSTMSQAMRIAVVGGGVSGLSAAWSLRKLLPTAHIELIESASRFGGWIYTSQEDGFQVEHGLRDMHAGGLDTMYLIQQLGIKDKIVPNASGGQQFIYSDGSLIPMDRSTLMKLSVPTPEADKTVFDLLEPVVGSKTVDTTFQAILNGMCAGDVRKFSAECFQITSRFYRSNAPTSPPKHPEWFMKIMQKQTFMLADGSSTLISALAQSLEQSGVKLHLNRPVRSVLRSAQGKLQIRYSNTKDAAEYDHVVSTVPASTLADMIQLESTRTKLRSIPTTNISVVNVGWNESSIVPEKFAGNGYLVPAIEKKPIMGVTFDSVKYPAVNGPNRSVVSVLAGGELFDVKALKENQLIENALKSLRDDLGITKAPAMIHVAHDYNSIPQYLVGHKKIVSEIRSDIGSSLPNLHVIGNSFDGVSLNDCIVAGKKAAEQISGKALEVQLD